MSVLLTRPHDLAVVSQQNLLKLGVQSLIVPAIEIKYPDIQIVDNNYDAIAITSQHAAVAVERNAWMKNIQAFAVGEKTKESLVRIGLNNVVSSNGDALDLEETIAQSIKPPSKILYLAGDNVSYNLDGNLQAKGYDVYKAIVYEAIARSSLSSDEIDDINSFVITILFYSSRTADIFCKLMSKYQIDLSNKIAICISESCAKYVAALNWREIRIADHPNEKEIFKLL
jgi:uroporphyrinogen-III synthase